jgi:hypothetical protein
MLAGLHTHSLRNGYISVLKKRMGAGLKFRLPCSVSSPGSTQGWHQHGAFVFEWDLLDFYGREVLLYVYNTGHRYPLCSQLEAAVTLAFAGAASSSNSIGNPSLSVQSRMCLRLPRYKSLNSPRAAQRCLSPEGCRLQRQVRGRVRVSSNQVCQVSPASCSSWVGRAKESWTHTWPSKQAPRAGPARKKSPPQPTC